MQTVVIVIHLMLVLAMIGVVLLQRSEGGGLGIGGGGGGFMTSRGTANVLTRATAILAVVFFVTSLILSILAGMDRKPTLDPGRAAPPRRRASARRAGAAAGGGGLLDHLQGSAGAAPGAGRPAAAGAAVAVSATRGPGNRPFALAEHALSECAGCGIMLGRLPGLGYGAICACERMRRRLPLRPRRIESPGVKG